MFLRYIFSNYWRSILAIAVTSILMAVFEGIGLSVFFPLFQSGAGGAGADMPAFLQQYVNFFLNFPLPERMRLIAGILIGSVVLKLLLARRNAFLTLQFKNEVTRHYRLECIRKVLSSGVALFNSKRPSDLNLMIDIYTEIHIGALVDLIGSSFPYLFTLIVLLAALLSLSWKMTLVAAVVVGGSAWALSCMSAVIRRRSLAMFEAKLAFNKTLFDVLNGFKTIRLFGGEAKASELFDERSLEYNRKYLSSSLLTVMVAPVFEVVGASILAVILVAGSFFIAKEMMSLGMVMAFIIILVRMIPPFKSMNHARASVVARIPALKDVEAFLKEADGDVPEGRSKFAGLRDGIEFRDVRFRYREDGPMVLEGVSLKIPKGARIGIIGMSGGGKSTLLELLLRFYDPQAGSILVDGVDLRELSRRTWLERIGVVAQDPFLFNDTVKMNILFSDPSASDDKVREAARKAYAHDFIMKLPQGYDTVVGERGALLSGGQRQRIAIARALLRDPEILLFDEATSALDAESETLVQKAILENSKGKTVITIAHRLSTLSWSDLIVVMDQGRIAQSGTHESLLTVDGTYRRFVQTQTI
jgi:subfamily B ATP-binding cassette protein MsbA